MEEARGVALVVGGTGALGAAIIESLERDGFAVVATWRSSEIIDRPAVRCDVRSMQSVRDCVEEVEARFGAIEVLVVNAGYSIRGLTIFQDPAEVEDIISTNLVGSHHVAAVIGQRMASRRRGRIIFVGSAAGLIGVPGHGAYSSAKAGLVGLCRTLARELGSRGITVNVIAPGMLDNAVQRIGSSKSGRHVVEEWISRVPLRREGTVEEVADSIAFLADPGCCSLTGFVLRVDGGLLPFDWMTSAPDSARFRDSPEPLGAAQVDSLRMYPIGSAIASDK